LINEKKGIFTNKGLGQGPLTKESSKKIENKIKLRKDKQKGKTLNLTTKKQYIAKVR
jgi:hypothetical protein